MDEQQIIGDILDKLYGYDSALREEDSEIIKAKKKEKDEKTKELKTQINNICKDLENELKAVLGLDVGGIKKIIRLQVLTSIKAEIDNGNNVIDSNGKISIGKTFDIIKQSKSEILEKIQAENDTVNYKKEDGDIIPEDSKEDKGLNNFFDKLDDAGIDLSQDEKDFMAESVARVNEIMNMIKEKVNSGMSKAEALKSILSGMSREEIELLRAQFRLAGQCKLFDSFLENEKNGQKDFLETEKADGKEDSSKGNANGQTPIYEEEPGTNSSLPLPDFEDVQFVFDGLSEILEDFSKENGDGNESVKLYENYTTLGFSDQTLKKLKCAEQLSGKMTQMSRSTNRENYNLIERWFQGLNYDEVISQHINPKDGSGTWDEKMIEEQVQRATARMYEEGYTTVTPETITEKLKRVKAMMHEERYTTLTPETIYKGNILKKEGLNPIAGTIIEQAKSYTTPLHEMRHTTIENKTISEDSIGELVMGSKISDKDIGPYFDRHSKLLTFSREELYADHFMPGESEGRNGLAEMRDDDAGIIEEPVSVTPASALTSTTPPSPAPTSIVEEMTVDGSDVTAGEQSGTSKKGILSASTMKALVESQAEARKMLEASGIIHGQTPERPTTGKPETQGAYVVDNDEDRDEEPEEH